MSEPLPPYRPSRPPPAYRPPAHRTNVLQAQTGSWYTVSSDGDEARLQRLYFEPLRREAAAQAPVPESWWRALCRYLCLVV